MLEEYPYMLFKSQDQKLSYKANMRGGQGSIKFNELLPVELLQSKGRLFSAITIEKGCSIGFHIHEDEIEVYYVIEGNLTYNENNEREYIIRKGDCVYNRSGAGHGVRNDSKEKAVLIALIFFV